MKLDSPLFNRIRVKPEPDHRPRAHAPACQWPGCACEATHRAPKGRTRENEYWRFCLEHVREYNSSYNYFAGMSDDAVARYQKDAVIGHRPTWKMGFNGSAERSARARTHSDPFEVLREFGAGRGRAACEKPAAGAAPDPQCRAQGVRHARARDRRDRGGDQGALQGAGEAPPSRRERRRPLDRASPDRGHPGVQLSQVGEILLTRFDSCAYQRSFPKIRSGTNSTTSGTKIRISVTMLTAIRNGVDSRVYSPIGQRSTWQVTNIAAPTGGV